MLTNLAFLGALHCIILFYVYVHCIYIYIYIVSSYPSNCIYFHKLYNISLTGLFVYIYIYMDPWIHGIPFIIPLKSMKSHSYFHYWNIYVYTYNYIYIHVIISYPVLSISGPSGLARPKSDGSNLPGGALIFRSRSGGMSTYCRYFKSQNECLSNQIDV